jgi:hypothetical protein
MNKRTEQYLAHPENRIRSCLVNALLGRLRGGRALADLARADLYKWVGIAQENNEQHF